jgi:ATP-dependent Lhr-like helicase
VSPLAVPVLLEIGRESVHGAALDQLLDDVTAELLAEAGIALPQAGAPAACQSAS